MVSGTAGTFCILERGGEIIATGAYKPYDKDTAEIKRIWTKSSLRQQDWRRVWCRNWNVGRYSRATAGYI
jgi:hypothetical protein